MLTPTQMTALSKPADVLGQPLTPRELEVVRGVSFGIQAKILARQMGISPSTVNVHTCRAMAKLGIHNAAGLTRYYMTHVDPPHCPRCG